MTLELKNVSKTVDGVPHIHPTSIALAEDGFNILLGTTLAGKTTLMQLMAGLERPTGGEVWFAGRNVTGIAVQKRNVSMVYQQFINYPNMSVYENIASPLRVARMKAAEIDRRVREISELLRLTPMLKRKPAELSGGQQQRTALARALVKDSDLILLDEPLANLDFKLREELREELPRLFSGRRCTVVYATTEPVEALLLGGHTAAMHEGAVTQFGPTGELYRDPADLQTARIFSEPPINTATALKQGRRIAINADIGWELPGAFTALPDGPLIVAIRPHHIRLVTGEERHRPDLSIIAGEIRIAEISGSESTVHFTFDEMTWISLSHGVHSLGVGTMADFAVDTGHCLYFTPEGRRLKP